MRPEAQLSDPMSWNTSVYMTKFSGRIISMPVPLSPKPWILRGKLFSDQNVTKAPETGYPGLVLVQTSLRLT